MEMIYLNDFKQILNGLFHSELRGPLTPGAVKELANVHYWSVSIIPVLLGSALAYTVGGCFDLLVFCLLLPAAVLMHCVVNGYNHLFDYLSGTDGLENKNNRRYPIMYYGVNPLYVLILGIVYLGLALLLSLYVVVKTGPVLLLIGAIGAFVAVFYSGGPYPLSHYPLGELASGFAMGGLIPFAVWYGMTASLDWLIFVYALPMIFTIGILCYINNICDIEKDSKNRKTIPILIGRKKASVLFRFSYALTWLIAFVLALICFTKGSWIMALAFVLALKKLKILFGMEYTPETRGDVMSLYGSLIPVLNIGYSLAILCHGLI